MFRSYSEVKRFFFLYDSENLLLRRKYEGEKFRIEIEKQALNLTGLFISQQFNVDLKIVDFTELLIVESTVHRTPPAHLPSLCPPS